MIFEDKGKYHIAWFGISEGISGYSQSNSDILSFAKKSQVRPHLVGTKEAEECEVGIAYAAPVHTPLERLPSPHRILYTMFEATTWPDTWVDTCDAANAVWVPSRFCKNSLLDSGCRTPIEVVPLGVDPKKFHPGDKADGPFTFGYAGAWTYRKGADLLQEAFLQEFKPGEQVRLRILSSNALTASVPDPGRIEMKIGRVSPHEVCAFYQSLDCFAMPTRGEGFGLTALEAMACGACAIVTGWGGNTDYMGEDTLGIGVESLQSCNGYHGSTGRWAKPSIGSLRWTMRWAYENRETVREMGMASAVRVARDWTYANTLQRIEEILANVKPGERVAVDSKRVVVWHGSPSKVDTRIGQFIRGIPRELTDEEIGKLNPSDMHPHGFAVERRYSRSR